MASALTEKALKPTDELLAEILNEGKLLWDSLKQFIFSTYEKPNEEWKFYGTKSGWTLAVFSGKRRLLNLIPQKEYFQAIFTLSENAAAIARSSDLPESIRTTIPTDTQCVCGYGLNIDIRTAADIDAAKKLLDIKDKN